jgi:hypothetical protein
MMKCPFCNSNINDKVTSYVDCPTCGKYLADPFFLVDPPTSTDFNSQKYILSGKIRESTEDNRPPIEITRTNFKELIESANIPDGPIEQIDRILLYIDKKFGVDNAIINIDNDYPVAFAKDLAEFNSLLRIAIRDGYLDHKGEKEYFLTMKSLNRLREIKRLHPESNQIFVAMSFKKELTTAYVNGIKPAIEETGYKPLRMDDLEHIDIIDDKIIAEIRKSCGLIVDLTDNNAGAYFEAGLAIGYEIKVIWTCREDYFKNVHFDANHYPFILWKGPDELKKRLIAKIEATMPLLGKITKQQ